MTSTKTTLAPTAPSVLPEYLTVHEAAKIGCCCRESVREWARQGRFRAFRRVHRGASRILIDRASFLEFMRGTPVVPATEGN